MGDENLRERLSTLNCFTDCTWPCSFGNEQRNTCSNVHIFLVVFGGGTGKALTLSGIRSCWKKMHINLKYNRCC